MKPTLGVEAFRVLLPLRAGELDRNEQRQVLSREGALVAVFAHECLASRVPQMEAAVEEVVRRVNAHDDLLDAIKGALKWCHQGHGDFPAGGCGLCRPLHAAIAKAEGRS